MRRHHRRPGFADTRSTRRRGLVLAIALVTVLAGCSLWSQGRADGGHTGNNPFERTIGVDTVARLAPTSSIVVPQPTAPVIGPTRIAYFTSRTKPELRAYDLARCGPSSCKRVFTADASAAPEGPALSGDQVYALTMYGVSAFDAHGIRSCSGTPTTCEFLWRDGAPNFGNPDGHLTDFVIDGDRLVAHVSVNDDGDELFVSSYDARGVTGCSTNPGPRECEPTVLDFVGAPTISGGNSALFMPAAAAGGRIVSVIAHSVFTGVQVRTADGVGAWFVAGDYDGDVVATPDRLWLRRATGELDTFDAAGVDHCVDSHTQYGFQCQPLRTSVAPAASVGAGVADGRLYVGAADGTLYAFDVAGDEGCAGSPVVCTPIWSAVVDTGSPVLPPTIANGVVYAVSASGVVKAFAAAGTVGCGGSPMTCTSLFTSTVGAAPAGPAVVGAGTMLVPTADKVVIFTLVPQ